MTRNRSSGRQFIACLRFELEKLIFRKLSWITLVIINLVVVASGFLAGRGADAPVSYALYAQLLGQTLPIAAFFLVIMGCLAINEEVSSGSMRAVLMRPVTRGEVILAKIVTLVGFALVVALFALTSSHGLVLASGGFTEVMIDDMGGLTADPAFTAESIRALSFKLSAATILPILCAPLFGLLISLFIDAAGSAVAVGVFLFGMMSTLGESLDGLRGWVFPTYIDHPVALLAEFAEGIETNRVSVEEMGLFSSEFLAPLVMIGVFAAVALLVFRTKEISC